MAPHLSELKGEAKMKEIESIIKEAVAYDNKTRNEAYFKAPAWVHALVDHEIPKDHSDHLYIDVLFNMTCWLAVTCPLVALGYLPGAIWLAIQIPFLMGRYTLLLHYTTHTPNSKRITWYVNYIISPFFGLPCDTYRYHHLYMHHVENNQIPWDTTTTNPYDRSSFLHFIVYWFRHLLFVNFELPYRTYMRRSGKDAIVLATKLLSYWVAAYYLYPYAPRFVFWCVAGSYVATTFLLMYGNWTQHQFVNPDSPDCNYNLTYNCIGKGSNNDKVFNDGYHIIHHEQSRLPWFAMADEFGANWKEHMEKGAIVFRGIDFMAAGFMIHTGQMEKLVRDHYVGYDEDIIGTLNKRLQPIYESYKSY